tara:strand:- start:9 stop:353 length:345 start_codon:yes stop_codon:yes gene_type:complete
MPKTTGVVKVELSKKLFQREKSKRNGYDYMGYKGEFVCRVGYVDIGQQTKALTKAEKKAGKQPEGKIILSSGFGDYSQKFKFADEEEATKVAIQLLIMAGHASIPRAYLKQYAQ